jgi:hypothetical protein
VTSVQKKLGRPEHELLLCCVGPVDSRELANRVRHLASNDLDWDYLFRLARRHAVVSLVFNRLQLSAADVVPANHLLKFRQYFQENAARNVLLTAELCRLIRVLADLGIEAIPYKGPALAEFAYGNQAFRRYVDLDLMVRKDDASKAMDVLLGQDYELSIGEEQRQLLLRTQHNVQFRREQKRLIVELHWEVASHLFAEAVTAEDLWRSLITIELNGHKVKTLAPEDLVFSLCVHGSRHLWEGLLWICDVGWIVSRHQLDWESLLERSRSTNSERMFLLGLNLAKELLSIQLPSIIEQAVEKDSSIRKLSNVVVESLFVGVDYKPQSSRRRLKYNLLIRKSWVARAKYIRHVLDPKDKDLEAISLPGPLSFGYYLMRPFRLLFKN